MLFTAEEKSTTSKERRTTRVCGHQGGSVGGGRDRAIAELDGRTSCGASARSLGGGKRELRNAITLMLHTSMSPPVSSSNSPRSVSTLSPASPSALKEPRRTESAEEWKVLARHAPLLRKVLQRAGGWRQNKVRGDGWL